MLVEITIFLCLLHMALEGRRVCNDEKVALMKDRFM